MAEQMMQEAAGKTIPAGYKQTEVGVIPEEWNVATIEELADIIDPQPDHRTPPESSNGEPYIGISDFINSREVDWTASRKIISKAVDKQEKCFQLQKGDIVFGKIGTIGVPKFVPQVPFRFALSANVILLHPKNVESIYLMGFFYSEFFQKTLKSELHSTSQAAFGMNKMRLIKLPLPPKEEQTAIANVLSDSDALIDALEQLIAKKQAIKTATMQQLLTGRTRLPQFALRPDGTPKGYKSSELGQIPEDWDALTYGDIFTFLSTATNSRADLSNSGDFGYIHYGDIHTKWNNKLDLCVFDLPRVSRHLVSSSFVENGDVIMADASEDYDGIGKSVEICNVGDDKIVSGLHTFLLRDKNQLLVDGYRGFLHSIPAVKKAFDRLATGMKVYGISKNNLIVVPVPLPPKQEQTAIATILSDMDSELAALEQKLAKARDLKQGMMQQLLTGKTRLKKPLKEAVHE